MSDISNFCGSKWEDKSYAINYALGYARGVYGKPLDSLAPRVEEVIRDVRAPEGFEHQPSYAYNWEVDLERIDTVIREWETLNG